MFDEDEGNKYRLLLVLGLAFLCAIGIMLDVLASVYFGGWWLLMVIFIYAFMPLPKFWGQQCGQDPFRATGTWKMLAQFWTGFLGASGLALPLVLAHAHVIKNEGLVMGFAGGVVVAASIYLYLHFFHKKRADDF